MGDLNNIWNDPKRKLPEDKLLAYLEGKLSLVEQHEVEQWLAGTGMEADAIEGLKELEGNESKEVVERINYRLRQTLGSKKNKRARPIKENNWALLAVVIILLLGIAAYIVLKFMKK